MNKNLLYYALENNLVLTSMGVLLFSRWSIIMIWAGWRFVVTRLLENAIL